MNEKTKNRLKQLREEYEKTEGKKVYTKIKNSETGKDEYFVNPDFMIFVVEKYEWQYNEILETLKGNNTPF